MPTAIIRFCAATVLYSFLLASCMQEKVAPTDTNEKIYETARRANDFSTALHAAYDIVYASDSNYQYYDSIALIYQTLGNAKGALEISRDGLEKHQSVLLEKISAHAMVQLAMYTDAIIKYQELMKLDPDNILKYQYAVGENFFYLKNYESCLEYMGLVVDNEKSVMVDMEMQTAEGVQKVPYKLAALNIIGYVMMTMEKYDDAEKVYNDILIKKPDFQLAANNYALLQELKKKKK